MYSAVSVASAVVAVVIVKIVDVLAVACDNDTYHTIS